MSHNPIALHVLLQRQLYLTSLPSVSRLYINCGSLEISQLYGPSWPVTGIALPYLTYLFKKYKLHW
jgi:hypothetical protein